MIISELKEGEKIDIKTIEQISQMTPEQFSLFVEDLKQWFDFIKHFKFINSDIQIIEFDTSKMTWVFDTKKEVNIVVNCDDETIAETKINYGDSND